MGTRLLLPWAHTAIEHSFNHSNSSHYAGTLLDLVSGFDKCKVQRQALESYMHSTEAVGQQGTGRRGQQSSHQA